ncbi:MAG: hypothetical protein ACSI46_20910 [Gloeotrichia echinulata DVL01]
MDFMMGLGTALRLRSVTRDWGLGNGNWGMETGEWKLGTGI